MARVCGWGPEVSGQGPACLQTVETTTFVGGLSLNGLTAPMVLDGPMTAARFLASVQQVLSPTLHTSDVVVLYNLPAHKGAATRKPSKRPKTCLEKPGLRFQSTSACRV